MRGVVLASGNILGLAQHWGSVGDGVWQVDRLTDARARETGNSMSSCRACAV